jgi:murein DD-endopeptidase MepM/ murein hydrolase activator NlpD
MVKRGQVMGTSGMTGMAAGDHIHFSMQLDGVQIDPKEFWDPHLIADHIAKRIDLPGFTTASERQPDGKGKRIPHRGTPRKRHRA